ncbi:MAG: hypothetical protein ABIT47_04080 [Candidatus Paceibacterota bacterium]
MAYPTGNAVRGLYSLYEAVRDRGVILLLLIILVVEIVSDKVRSKKTGETYNPYYDN